MTDHCIFCGAKLGPMETNNPDFHSDKVDKDLREILLNGACCWKCNKAIVIPARIHLMTQSKRA